MTKGMISEPPVLSRHVQICRFVPRKWPPGKFPDPGNIAEEGARPDAVAVTLT